MQAVRRSGKRRSVWLGLIAGLCAFAIPASAANAAPWPCDGAGYVTQFDGTNPAAGTSFNRADRQPDDTYQLTELGNPAAHLNAIGFRPQDGFMYGLINAGADSEIVRIERDASGNATFTPMGLPAGSGSVGSVVGAILSDGTYLVWNHLTDTGEIFDVSGPTAQLVTTVTVDPATPGGLQGDFAVSPVDGQIYGIFPDSSDPTPTFGVYSWTLSGGTLTRGPRVADGASAGAGFFQADGKYIMYVNGTQPPPMTPPEGAGLYSVDFTTGQRTFLGSGPILSNVDGTSCANGIAVSKDAAPRTVVQGRVVTYTHTITSRALVESPVDFSDRLPAGMTYVPGGVTVDPSSFGTPNDFGDTRDLSVSGSLAPGETVTITARARVSSGVPCETDVQNQSQAGLVVAGLPPVTVDSDDPTTPADPQDPTTVHVICESDVALTKAAPGRVDPSGNITWTMTVTNNGPSASSGSTVTDAIPPEVTDPATQTPGCAITNGTLECAIGALGVGDSTEVVVTGTAPTQANTSVTNAASVEGEQDDPVLENNSDSVQTSIRRGKPRLVIKKRTGNKKVRPGEVIRYRIKVRNKGNRTARGVRVCDKMPSGLRLLRAPKANKTKAHKACWWVKRLRAGKKRRFRVVAQVKTSTGAGKLTNRAMVKARNAKKRKRNKARVRVIQPPTSACRIPQVAARC